MTTPHPQFSEQGFLEHVEYDDTALEDVLREAHREHFYHSQREGLSGGQSSSFDGATCVESISQEFNVANAQIRTLLDRQKEVCENWEICCISARRTSLRSS